jgi:phosphoribosylformylglycinamidine cyclo-ligase
LDVSSLGDSVFSPEYQAVLDLFRGLKNAAEKIGIIVLNGETAELSSLVSSENPGATLKYNWGGSVHGLYHPDKMITGDKVAAGQVVVAFKENGFRSNGISSVRKAFSIKFGENWFCTELAQKYLLQAATPSLLYDKLFVDANGWLGNPRIDIKAIIHLTGGSFKSKLGDSLS